MPTNPVQVLGQIVGQQAIHIAMLETRNGELVDEIERLKKVGAGSLPTQPPVAVRGPRPRPISESEKEKP